MSEHSQNRWYLFDTLRGFTLINMVLFHFLYDVFIIYEFSPGWNERIGTILWQNGICWTFILIAGTVFHFSHSHLKRGLQLNLWGFLFTLVTYFALPEETIWFGILNFIGCGILLTALLEPVLLHIKPAVGFAGSLLLFFLSEGIPNGALGCYGLRLVTLPKSWYRYFPGALIGFPPDSFSSSDYFPVIPWIFVFWMGYYLYLLLKNSSLEKWVLRGKFRSFQRSGERLFGYISFISLSVCWSAC